LREANEHFKSQIKARPSEVKVGVRVSALPNLGRSWKDMAWRKRSADEPASA
jgi:hypothetical protein